MVVDVCIYEVCSMNTQTKMITEKRLMLSVMYQNILEITTVVYIIVISNRSLTISVQC